MRYLLDTNTWIHYLKHADSPVAARLRRTSAQEVAVCSVVWAELLHGARKYEKRDQRVARIEQTLSPFRSLPFDDAPALLDQAELVLADLGEREALLRSERPAVAADPSRVGVLAGESAGQAPPVIVLVDAQPGVDLQPDLVAILDRLAGRAW